MTIDAHQHYWDVHRLAYDWLRLPGLEGIDRSFLPTELVPQLADAGIDGTVLVQCLDSSEETDYLFEVASATSSVAGVVGWVPLTQRAKTESQLETLIRRPKFSGIRHLVHLEADPDWIVRDEVLHGLSILADRDVPFDLVAVLPRHLEHVPTVMERVPGLRLVIDHLGKPPIKEGKFDEWSQLLRRAARYESVCAKVSGLNTAADWQTWSANDLQPYVDEALQAFGASRLMFGSDWPVATLAGTYDDVWRETKTTMTSLSDGEREAVFGGTANRFYGLGKSA